jgi:hypothetical protein
MKFTISETKKKKKNIKTIDFNFFNPSIINSIDIIAINNNRINKGLENNIEGMIRHTKNNKETIGCNEILFIRYL